VLSRTDYGEKDRILTIITPNYGKLKAIAKSVRSAKSRLAGGIELFADNELGLVEGRGELYTVTFSKMKRYFGDIARDMDKSAYAYECLKAVNKLAPEHAGGVYYDGLAKLLEALSENKVLLAQIKIWYGLELLDTLGASPNFKTDLAGKELAQDKDYQYDFDKHCFFEKPAAPYGSDHIKILRHLSKTSKPAEIKGIDEKLVDSAERLVALLLSEHIK
jgi:DNA repair protein RecO (recombination protein O)